MSASTALSAGLGHLRAARPEELLALAGRLTGQAGQVRRGAAELAGLAPAFAEWDGPAQREASGRHTEVFRLAGCLADGLDECGLALRNAAEGVRAAQRLADRAQDQARTAGAQLRDDGSVIAAGVPLDPAGEAARAAARLAAARTAERACADYRAALVGLAARLDTATTRYAARASRSVGTFVGTSDVSAPPADPDAAAVWFASLSEQERDRLVTSHPEWVGSCEGLPGWARDRANRILLGVLAATLLAEARTHRHGSIDPGDYWGPAFGPAGTPRRVAEVLAKLDGLRSVQQVLNQPDGRHRQLLHLDASGSVLTAAVTSGDLDTAGHIAVFVPGFQADVAGDLARYSREVEDAADLAGRLSRTHGDGRPVVGVTWLGYAAPALLEVLTPGRSVAGWGPARSGAPALGRLLGGLDAAGRSARPAAPPRLVVWGHSYGSVVTGLALRENSVPVSAAVAFGSPGMGVDAVSELHLPPGGLYVAEALDDVVAATSRFAADPGLMPGAVQLSVAAQVLPDGSVGRLSMGHEEYLVPGSTSQWNLAAVAAGTTDLIRTRPACPPRSLWSPPPPACERPLRIG